MKDNERKVGLFEEIDPSDREGLFLKATTSAKWIKGFAIFNIVLLLLLGFLFLYANHLIKNSYVNIDGQNLTPIPEKGLVIITIGTIISSFIFWYSSKLLVMLKERIIPSLTIPYVILGLKIILQLYDLTQRIEWVGIIINIFVCYLWYVIIDCVRKIEKI